MPLRSLFDLNWTRLSRWCLLGAVVMVLWLLAPVARCTLQVFRGEHLDEAMPVTDGEREPVTPDFFSRVKAGVQVCYARTPLFGQEAWKRKALFAFAGASVVTHLLSRLRNRGRRSYG